jgi:predicted DsbA family dithiol-disulfide isomerase
MNGDRAFQLFSDFNCPFCYVLHERLHELELIDRCAWRGVQHAPHLPRTLKAWQASSLAELQHEVAVVRRLAPDLPIALPRGKPNTHEAILCAAQRIQEDPLDGLELVRNIYRAFWCEGRDISDRQVLEDLARWPVETTSNEQVRRIAQDWTAAWQATGQCGVPLLVDSGGDLLVGCVPREQIVDFFQRERPTSSCL